MRTKLLFPISDDLALSYFTARISCNKYIKGNSPGFGTRGSLFLFQICLKHLRPPGMTMVNEKMDEEVVIVLVLDEEMVEDVKVVLAVKTRVVVLIPL